MCSFMKKVKRMNEKLIRVWVEVVKKWGYGRGDWRSDTSRINKTFYRYDSQLCYYLTYSKERHVIKMNGEEGDPQWNRIRKG